LKWQYCKYAFDSLQDRGGINYLINIAPQVEAYANSIGLSIGGYYHVNEHLTDKEVPSIAAKIAAKIQANSEATTCLLMVRIALLWLHGLYTN